MSKPKVAIVRADSYDDTVILNAVKECFELLKDDIPEMSGKVLLKPNMIFPKPPEMAATTHPAVVKAVSEYLHSEMGLTDITVGDSPGGVINNIERFWKAIGMKEAEANSPFSLVSFETEKKRKTEINVNGKKTDIFISGPVDSADYIINLPKLKNHSLTLFTGALKNIYGIIPGLLKATLHKTFQHPFDFAAFIIEINRLFRPTLHIMDGVIGMEGEGPSSGTPRETGVIIASTDPAALDATAVKLIGIEPLDVPMLKYAADTGFGCVNISEMDYPGLSPDDINIKPYKRPNTAVFTRIPRFLYRILYSFVKTRPYMTDSCAKCMKCAKMCPVDAIELKDKDDHRVTIDYKKCISCFCCNEVCEYHAVELKASWLAQKLLPSDDGTKDKIT